MRLCLSLPGRITFVQHMYLPAAEPSKLAAMVKHEAPRYIPLPLDKLVWGYQTLGPKPSADRNAAGPKMVSVHFCGARTDLVEARLEILKRHRLSADAAQSESLALHNLWSYENSAEAADIGARSASEAEGQQASLSPRAANSTVALLDIGGESSNLVVSSPAGIWARPISFGGLTVTRALVKEFKLSFADAERFKRNPSLAPGMHKFSRVVEPGAARPVPRRGNVLARPQQMGVLRAGRPHARFRRRIRVARTFATAPGRVTTGSGGKPFATRYPAQTPSAFRGCRRSRLPWQAGRLHHSPRDAQPQDCA